MSMQGGHMYVKQHKIKKERKAQHDPQQDRAHGVTMDSRAYQQWQG